MRAHPWETITDALTNVGTDAYILVKGDDNLSGQCGYDEDLLIGAVNAGTRIQGYYGSIATDKPPMQTGYVRVEADGVTFDGFEVTGPSISNYVYSTFQHAAKLGMNNADNVIFRHLYIHNIGYTSDLCKAILAWGGGSLTVENVLEVDLEVSRIKNGMHQGLPTMTIRNCTFDRLGNDSGIVVGGFYRSADNGAAANIVNSIWTDLGADGFYYICRTTNGPLNFDYSCTSDTPVAPDGGYYFFQVTPGAGCITSDPDYVNPMSNHHLESGSPCINTGDPSITDYDSSPSDMGCYGGPFGDWDFEN